MSDKHEPASSGSGTATSGRLTPLDVQQKEFRVSIRGYNEREVDEFLDRVTEELQRYEAEVMRLRSERAAFEPAASDVDAESQRILRDARDRAEAIVREAEARAAGIPVASATDARAVVAPYLNREREFLQRLGTLVQDHAQTIKTMVEEARRRAEPQPAAAEGTPADEQTAVAAAQPDGDRADAELFGPATDAAGTSATGDPVSSQAAAPGDDAADPAMDASEEEVVILAEDDDDRVGAAPERAPDERTPEGARSLRELFWDED
jgi:cell division initiation protein